MQTVVRIIHRFAHNAVDCSQLECGSVTFWQDERGPDEDLRVRFEAISRFDAEENQVIRPLLEGMILKHEARRWTSNGGANNGERK